MTEQQKLDTAILLMEEYIKHVDSGRLKTSKVPNLVWSHNLSTGGRCYHDGRIIMSAQAFDEHGIAETMDTWRHELAHLVHMNHSHAFWQLAWSLGVKHTTAHSAARPLTGKYTYKCPNGHEIVTQGKFRVQKSCSKCSRRFDRRYLLVLQEGSVENKTTERLESELAALEAQMTRLQQKLKK